MLPFFMSRSPNGLQKEVGDGFDGWGWDTNLGASIYIHTRLITHTNKKHI